MDKFMSARVRMKMADADLLQLVMADFMRVALMPPKGSDLKTAAGVVARRPQVADTESIALRKIMTQGDSWISL